MRLRIFDSEIAGEKLVTRHVLTQAQHNADDLAEIKTQLRHFRDDMVLVKAAQVAQGGTLNILLQDVTALRNDATELRRGQEAMNARLDAELGEMNRKLDAGLGEMNRRLDVELGQMNRKLDAILAAVSPHGPA